MCKIWSIISHAHTHIISVWQKIMLLIFSQTFPKNISQGVSIEYFQAQFCIYHLLICSLSRVHLMFPVLTIFWLFSWHLAIFLLFLSLCLQKLIWYFQRYCCQIGSISSCSNFSQTYVRVFWKHTYWMHGDPQVSGERCLFQWKQLQN